MTNFAVINDGIVVNLIVADTKEIAEEVTGMTCVEIADGTPVEIDGTWDGNTFARSIRSES